MTPFFRRLLLLSGLVMAGTVICGGIKTIGYRGNNTAGPEFSCFYSISTPGMPRGAIGFTQYGPHQSGSNGGRSLAPTVVRSHPDSSETFLH